MKASGSGTYLNSESSWVYYFYFLYVQPMIIFVWSSVRPVKIFHVEAFPCTREHLAFFRQTVASKQRSPPTTSLRNHRCRRVSSGCKNTRTHTHTKHHLIAPTTPQNERGARLTVARATPVWIHSQSPGRKKKRTRSPLSNSIFSHEVVVILSGIPTRHTHAERERERGPRICA